MIYFLRSGAGPIKIGYAKQDVISRVRQLQTASFSDLTPIGVMEGDVGKEREIHRRFIADWISGEWFHPTEDLMLFVKENASPVEMPPRGKVGRRPISEVPNTDTPLRIRLTGAERELLDRFAGRDGVPTSTWARDALLALAARAMDSKPDLVRRKRGTP